VLQGRHILTLMAVANGWIEPDSQRRSKTLSHVLEFSGFVFLGQQEQLKVPAESLLEAVLWCWELGAAAGCLFMPPSMPRG